MKGILPSNEAKLAAVGCSLAQMMKQNVLLSVQPGPKPRPIPAYPRQADAVRLCVMLPEQSDH